MHAMRVLSLPGLGSSGPTHWQTRWEQLYGYERVQQHDWEHPTCDAWLTQLRAAVSSGPTPVVLVAHSLGVALVAHFAAQAPAGQIAAALLVAPADVEDVGCTPDATRCFAPLPRLRFGFSTTLVASRNDPYMRFDSAVQLAQVWGARMLDLGAAGHINADSDLGDWAAGHALLQQLLTQ
jgi:predicted alpha/beta hydrolase family esterase